jgi:hypothetical protein
VALVGLGKLGQQLGEGGALGGQQLARQAVPCRGAGPGWPAGPWVGQAFGQPVALQRVDSASDVAGGHTQLAAQVEQAPRPTMAERAQQA